MSMKAWIIGYLVQLVFWIWVLRWGGAKMLEGSWIAWLLGISGVTWDEERVKFWAWVAVFTGTGAFVLGLFYPQLRFSRRLIGL